MHEIIKKIPYLCSGFEAKMRKQGLFLFIVCCLSCLPVHAEKAKEKIKHFVIRVDSMLNHSYYNISADTNFITRPATKWTIKARYNLSGTMLDGRGVIGGEEFRSHAYAMNKNTISLVTSYTGLTIAVTVNPSAYTGRYKDYEFNTNEYYNRMGIDFIYQRAKSFKGWAKYEGKERIYIPNDLISMRSINFNWYYAFNHKRFSYPASFCQSYIQKKSAGSFMLGASLQWQRLKIKQDENIGNRHLKLKVVNLGVGAGYGYNFALPHQWLIHLSALPTIIVYSHNNMWLNSERQNTRYHFPEVILTGRGAIWRTFNRYFVGATIVYNYTMIGSKDRLEITNSKWRARAFFGVRF